MLVPQAMAYLTYGPAAGAMVQTNVSSVNYRIGAYGRCNQVVAATSSVPFAKATRLVNSPMTVTGTGAMVQALPKARARGGAVIKVNELTAGDVTGAVLEAEVEAGYTLKQVLRLLAAYAAGDATGLDGGSVVFKGLDDSTRLAGTIASGVRTVTTRNGD